MRSLRPGFTRAWAALEFPNMVRRDDQFSARALRTGIGAYGRQRGRAKLPARRRAREAARADGGLGALLRAASRRQAQTSCRWRGARSWPSSARSTLSWRARDPERHARDQLAIERLIEISISSACARALRRRPFQARRGGSWGLRGPHGIARHDQRGGRRSPMSCGRKSEVTEQDAVAESVKREVSLDVEHTAHHALIRR